MHIEYVMLLKSLQVFVVGGHFLALTSLKSSHLCNEVQQSTITLNEEKKLNHNTKTIKSAATKRLSCILIVRINSIKVQSFRHQICDFSRDIILYDFVYSNIGTIFDSTNYS